MNPTANGQPIRFFAVLMIAWVSARLASTGFGIASPPLDYRAIATSTPARASVTAAISAGLPPAMLHRSSLPPSKTGRTAGKENGVAVDLTTFTRFTTGFANQQDASMDADLGGVDDIPPPLASPPAIPFPSPPSADRWRGSAWLLWRGGSGTAELARVGRLGGSQTGARLDFDLTPGGAGRAAAYARIAGALEDPAAPEGAIGLSYQPVRAIPVSLAAERRIALGKGARNAMALMLVGGFGPMPIAGPVEANGYAQAGVVGFHARDRFIDGRLSLLAPVAHPRLRIGGSVSGGAQPHVARLDIGPEARFRLPLPHATAHIGVEWRARVAGRAAPASGLAVTLATDF